LPLSRPLRLFPQPFALDVVSVVPDGPPLVFTWGGMERRIERTWGPERIQTGWWRARGVGRDYYRVETSLGHRFWLFRQLADGRWFLHGVFE
jgi:protein ImuB